MEKGDGTRMDDEVRYILARLPLAFALSLIVGLLTAGVTALVLKLFFPFLLGTPLPVLATGIGAGVTAARLLRAPWAIPGKGMPGI
jgi:hypothetical protein